MRRPYLSRVLLALLVTGLCLAQSSSQFLTAEVRRVGGRLACLCGSCKNTVGDCPMLQCHYSSPARERIAKMLAEGKSDDAIVDDFVKREGTRALAAPPAEGFNLLGWVMPFFMLGLGFGAVVLYMKRFRKPAPAPPTIDRSSLDRYHDQIEKDLAKLD